MIKFELEIKDGCFVSSSAMPKELFIDSTSSILITLNYGALSSNDVFGLFIDVDLALVIGVVVLDR